MAETTENTQELKTIQIGETLYKAESLTEQGVNIINDIKKVDAQLAQQQLSVSITQLAKSKLMEELQKETANFEAVPEDPAFAESKTEETEAK